MKKALLLALKGVIWIPAALFWGAVAWGVPLDFRTDEEVQEDEMEVRRLERFFDVEHLPEADYLIEWRVKEEALADIIDKLLRSHKFIGCMLPGAYTDDDTSEGGLQPADAQRQQPGKASRLNTEADRIEVSYVLPPSGYGRISAAAAADGELGSGALTTQTGPRPWRPRIVLAHREGSLALISAAFEYVARGKDREERWACTALRADLVSYCDGDTTCESICDLRGPLPHGVRYMRI